VTEGSDLMPDRVKIIVRCPACGSVNVELLAAHADWAAPYRCRDCHLTFNADSPQLRASAIHNELAIQLRHLQELDRLIKESADQDVRERLRAGSVSLAIEHLEIARAAVLRASEEWA
jgi:transposase-like protein